MTGRYFDPDRLRSFGAAIVTAEGSSDDIATEVADVLVRANLRGHDSHGIARLTLYDQMIGDGAIDPTATPQITMDTPLATTIDGNRLFGQAVGGDAVAMGLDSVDQHGMGLVGVRNAGHLGRIGEWAERAVDAGYGFLSFVNTQGGAQAVAPPGTSDRRLSTNPITIGLPTFDALPFDLILDMATSQVANGKIHEHQAAAEPLPAAWTVGTDGDPVVDPDRFIDANAGALSPLGGTVAGYKGFGLAVMAELFAGIAGDSPVAGETDPVWFNNAAWFLLFDPDQFTDRARLEARVEALATHLRSATDDPSIAVGPGSSVEHMLLPGEFEYQTTQRRREQGIPLPERTVAALDELAMSLDIDRRLVE